MIEKMRSMVEICDLIVVGDCGIITSTGGSINVDIDVKEIIKGICDCKKVKIAFQVMGLVSQPELKKGDRYIFILKARQFEEMTFYSPIQDDPTAIIPFNDQTFQEIQTLAAGGKKEEQKRSGVSVPFD